MMVRYGIRTAARFSIATAMMAGWAIAETPPAEIVVPSVEATPSDYPEFTFKRIGAPKSTTARRITVQIDPEEQARRLAAGPLPPAKNPIPRGEAAPGLKPSSPASPSRYDWYWDAVSPAIGDGDGRFASAITALEQGPDGKAVAAPRLQHLQDIATVHGSEILKATIGTDVSPALVLAVIGIESAGKSDAVSSAGAVGLMQLIPATADRFGVSDSTIPAQNIKGGVAYLDWLMKEFNRDPLMVLAAYNAGENAVKKNGGVPPFAETRAYVPKVLAAWMVARGLCVTPPELVSDGCVFTVNG
ncbi:MAG: lytic transglycosylase domain-containing protein [Albidovulum sp.]|uniref:lytic transglycosylase domain-containing protein n=1 Tax=Albidovulum sp. TaxID=1872424 RepID=UPI003CA7D152